MSGTVASGESVALGESVAPYSCAKCTESAPRAVIIQLQRKLKNGNTVLENSRLQYGLIPDRNAGRKRWAKAIFFFELCM